MQKKSFNTPDQTMTPPKAKVEIVVIEGKPFRRYTFYPGWKWSEHLKQGTGTETCQNHHILCATSGHLKVVMDDGAEIEVAQGDVADIPPGHDAWVVGDEPAVGIDMGDAIDGKPE